MGDRDADCSKELLLAGGRAEAQQPRGTLGCVSEPTRHVGGHVDGLTGAGDDGHAAEHEVDLTVQNREHLLEVMAVRRRSSARGDMHVDQGVPAGGVLAGDEDRVGIADDAEVRQGLVGVRSRVVSCRVGSSSGIVAWRAGSVCELSVIGAPWSVVKRSQSSA